MRRPSATAVITNTPFNASRDNAKMRPRLRLEKRLPPSNLPALAAFRQLLFAALLGLTAGARADEAAARVVLLANRDDPDSLRIAAHYAQVRGVPAENIVALPLPLVETISWKEFVRVLWQPLETELVRRKWIDAIAMNLTDPVGRTKYAVSGHRISYLVVCRGVPLRVMHEPEFFVPNPPLTNKPEFRTNAGAVDAELSLLAQPNYPINAFLLNPLFHDDRPGALDRSQVVKVSRLDGPTADDANALVDRAVEAERSGLLGRAYVDIGGNHPDGDRWFESAAKQLLELGFDTAVDRSPKTFPLAARFDAPVLYLGWYTGTVDGPFTLPGFRFPPGAIALHLHSFSAATLRSTDQNWCGPFLARGVTATVGNVFEPYLQFTHRPDYLLRALARGDTFGDAVFYSLPELSWQAVAIGDPLYRPFGVGFETQWKNRATLTSSLHGYLVVRRMLQLEAAHQPAEALALARQTQRTTPSFAVGLALAERLKAAGDPAAAANALAFVPLLEVYRPDEWALVETAAALLADSGKPAAAVATMRNLFRVRALPRELRATWLPAAIEWATAARNADQAEAWRRALVEATAPPPAK